MRTLAITAALIVALAIVLGEYDLHAQKTDVIEAYETYISNHCTASAPVDELGI